MSEPTRLVTVPERMAAMRCCECAHEWSDLDAAMSENPTPCPACQGFVTEPAYDVDGALMPVGWTW